MRRQTSPHYQKAPDNKSWPYKLLFSWRWNIIKLWWIACFLFSDLVSCLYVYSIISLPDSCGSNMSSIRCFIYCKCSLPLYLFALTYPSTAVLSRLSFLDTRPNNSLLLFLKIFHKLLFLPTLSSVSQFTITVKMFLKWRS